MASYERYRRELEALERIGRRRAIPQLHLERTDWVNLSSNDYLSLSHQPPYREEELRDYLAPYLRGGLSSTSSRLITGEHEVNLALEEELRESYQREAALLFGSGYHMNLGILPALSSPQTLILADKLVHASLIDGIRLSEGSFARFRHNDLKHLERLLEKKSGEYEEIFVVVESLYSMDGDRADLPALVQLKKRFPKVRLYVDEAHAVGCYGRGGLGLAEEAGLTKEIDLIVATFGKALASHGGFLISDNVVREYLLQRARPLIFSTALPPIVNAVTLFHWRLLPQLTGRRAMLHESAKALHEALRERNIPTIGDSYILPILLGRDEQALEAAQGMREAGYLLTAIRPPTVPEGSSRLRLSLRSEGLEVEALVDAIDKIYRRFGKK